MDPVWTKLNYKGQTAIVVLNAPESFRPQIESLRTGAAVSETLDPAANADFILAFVTTQAEVDTVAAQAAQMLRGDDVLWFAYPKASSKRYRCAFNRDTGWAALGEHGFEGVRQVAIDEDWSALRFRRTQYIKTLRRDQSRAMSASGKARVGKQEV